MDVRGDIVIDEEDHLTWPADALDLADHPVNRAVRLSGVEVGLNRAEITFELAPSCKLHQSDAEISPAPPPEDRTIGRDSQSRSTLATVHLFASAVPIVVDDPREE